MIRIERDFVARPPEEKQWLLQNTWCDACAEPDLGMRDAREFTDGDVIFVEGACLKCSAPVRSEVIVRRLKPRDDGG